MSGLSLRTGVSAGVSSGYTGTYAPMTPASANPPTARTIGQDAYGISGSGYNWNPNTAAIGSVTVGFIALAALIYLWWSLPR